MLIMSSWFSLTDIASLDHDSTRRSECADDWSINQSKSFISSAENNFLLNGIRDSVY